MSEGQQSSWLRQNAEALAGIIHEIAKWGKNHPNARRYSASLVKLPPVFLNSAEIGKRNLVAMIKTLADYEESDDHMTLAELPERYNSYGGLPALQSTDMRKVHNWLHQVSFALRAAILEQEERTPTRKHGWENLDIAERVAKRLYHTKAKRRSFVTYAPNHRYELKPLRYASNNAICNWIRMEYEQKHSGARAGTYGAVLTDHEWAEYGLRGQTKVAVASEITHFIEKALEADLSGNYADADMMDASLQQICDNLCYFEQPVAAC